MTDQLASPLCPETPHLPRKMLMPVRSSRSASSDVLCLSQLLDPQLCDSCACLPVAETDTRFSVSMVSHQLPSLDCPADWEQLDVASLVAHMVTRLLGDEAQLRQNYLNYVENFIQHDSPHRPHQPQAEQDHSFISSFLSHCLPLLSPDSDPGLCHLITSLAAHLARPETERNSGRQRSSEEEMEEEEVEEEGNIETPESLRSLETVNYFPSKHLLSNYSEGQLDRNFSMSSPSSLYTGTNQKIIRSTDLPTWHHSIIIIIYYSSEPDEEAVWLEEETSEDDVENIVAAAEDVFNRHDFERRDLSVVYEEMEESEDDLWSDVEQIVTGVCTIEADKGISIQTILQPTKNEAQPAPALTPPPPALTTTKRVTFSEEFPVIINNYENITQTPIKGDQLNGNQGEMKCRKCRTKQTFNVRLSLLLSPTEEKNEKKSVFDFIVGWFRKFL